MLEEVEAGIVIAHTLRKAERIANGQAHIGLTQLCLDRAIGELHHRVDDALRMHKYLDRFGRRVKEPSGLDHLQPLIHQRGGVNGDLSSHTPVGVTQSSLDRHGLKLLYSLIATEGTSRCREQDALQRIAFLPDEALIDSRVLRVDRQDTRSMTSSE